MNIEEIFKNSKTVSMAGKRFSMSIRHSEDLNMKIKEIAESNRFTIGQVYDMALFHFINDFKKVDMSKYPELNPEKKSNIVDTSTQCKECFRVYHMDEHDSCPNNCGA